MPFLSLDARRRPSRRRPVSPETPAAAQPLDPPKVEQADPNKPVEAPPLPAKASAGRRCGSGRCAAACSPVCCCGRSSCSASIVTWKKLRRRKGLKAPDPARRVSTAWTLATDALVDAGATLQTSHTNAELVEAACQDPAGGRPAAGPAATPCRRGHVRHCGRAIRSERADAVDQLQSRRVEHPQLVVAMVAMEVVAQHALVAPPHAITVALIRAQFSCWSVHGEGHRRPDQTTNASVTVQVN